jgi:hypothetical protein
MIDADGADDANRGDGWLKEIRNQNNNRFENGQCRYAAANFLHGLQNAETLDRADTFYLCFWCCDGLNYDPSDPTWSQYHYRNY